MTVLVLASRNTKKIAELERILAAAEIAGVELAGPEVFAARRHSRLPQDVEPQRRAEVQLQVLKVSEVCG